jgi:hypothetical protein
MLAGTPKGAGENAYFTGDVEPVKLEDAGQKPGGRAEALPHN